MSIPKKLHLPPTWWHIPTTSRINASMFLRLLAIIHVLILPYFQNLLQILSTNGWATCSHTTAYRWTSLQVSVLWSSFLWSQREGSPWTCPYQYSAIWVQGMRQNLYAHSNPQESQSGALGWKEFQVSAGDTIVNLLC